MTNKRLLIKNIISHHDEGTFFDNKSEIDISSEPGKAKFLKHISALSNSNPKNDSFLIFGVDSETILGVSFFDDSKIQNLIKSYLINAPIVKYENISFPELPTDKSVGLLTISERKETTYFSKKIWKIKKGAAYYRYGSSSILKDVQFYIDENNIELVNALYKNSTNNLKSLLESVLQFMKDTHKSYFPEYLIFEEQFVLCWSAWRLKICEKECYSEINVQLINENVNIFISPTKYADIEIKEKSFIITELVVMGFDDNYQLSPFEKTVIEFSNNGTYKISKYNVFVPPYYSKKLIKELYQRAKKAELLRGKEMKEEEYDFLEGLANYFLICYLNGIDVAKQDLINSKKYLDGSAAEWQTECIRILNEYERNR